MLGVLSEEQKKFESEDAKGCRHEKIFRAGRKRDLEQPQDPAAERGKAKAKGDDGQQCEETRGYGHRRWTMPRVRGEMMGRTEPMNQREEPIIQRAIRICRTGRLADLELVSMVVRAWQAPVKPHYKG